MGLTSDRGAGERSDLARIKKWWRGLGGDGFVALPPPTRSRYTQSDGHEDAAELFAARGITGRASFAYWHWQSHAAFDRTGALRGRLYLHWGGDHATVAAGLGAGPEGYRLVNNGPQGAFELDRVTATDRDGLPDPGTRQGYASSSTGSAPTATATPPPRSPAPRSAGSTTAWPERSGRSPPPTLSRPPAPSPPPTASPPPWSCGRR